MRPWIEAIACAAFCLLAFVGGAFALGEQSDGVLSTRADDHAYLEPIEGLTADQRFRFKRGRVGFFARWVVFPSLAGEWGLGPLFNAEACADCHVNGGRAAPPAGPDEVPVATLARVSIPGKSEHGGPSPDPRYGGQIQTLGLMGVDPRAHGHGERVRPEADVNIRWVEHAFTYPDGTTVSLRAPELEVAALEYGDLSPDAAFGLRHAQPIFGLGLLEAVPDEAILVLEARQAAWDLAGRANRVWNIRAGEHQIGRFGWKANQPTVRQQIETAFHEDIGVTSETFAKENCTAVQMDCLSQPPGNQPELIAQDAANLELWTLALAVPAPRETEAPDVQRGKALFAETGCAACHRMELQTGDHPLLPQLGGRRIEAYTDLLVHDMGPGLCNGMQDYLAGPCDWRTQPLWGLGLAAVVAAEAYLHDGRARTIEEAILWHGGEARKARDRFAGAPKNDRSALLRFLGSL